MGGGLFGSLDRPLDVPPPLPPDESVLRGRGEAEVAGRRRARPVPSSRTGRGVPVRVVQDGSGRDVAWAATLLTAAFDRAGSPGVTVRREHLRSWRRVVRPGRLLLFVVDASGYMGGSRLDLAQQVAEDLLRDAYLRRDRVGMIAFAGRRAELVFAPTGQAELVRRAVAGVTPGGTTPLAAALQRAREVLAGDARRDRARRPWLVLLTDGRANVGSRPGDPTDEVRAAASALAAVEPLRVLFLDATADGRDDRPARNLARDLEARRVVLHEQDRDVNRVVRAAIAPW